MNAITVVTCLRALVLLGACLTIGCQMGRTRSLVEERFTFTPLETGGKTEVSCTAITSLSVGPPSGISGVSVDRSEMNRLIARIQDGTDRVALRIERDHLMFLTEASFEGGQAEGSRFPVIENTAEHITAFESHDRGSFDSFVLNKHSGLAIWTRVQPSPVFRQDVPDSQTIYLSCV